MKNDNHVWDNKLPTAQMLGRWQPWHAGHQKLFEEILKKTGQVNIMVRDVQGVADNPFDFDTDLDRLEWMVIMLFTQKDIKEKTKWEIALA